ncbi:hypothetical protein TWF694_008939 [Orbilia ellipsospora]|uniref:Uncharacterized protein n=1 Tax=Orbilia ellipsospora TaxID=2528407 RepID=A0AAV9XDD7_9PEZI
MSWRVFMNHLGMRSIMVWLLINLNLYCMFESVRRFSARMSFLSCVGSERLSSRYEGDHEEIVNHREASGFGASTYKSVLDEINDTGKEGKRVFIKDMASYLVPPSDHPTFQNANLAPSVSGFSGTLDAKNPTVVPLSTLKKFQFAFLIRDPRRAVPSYYRCCIPPLNKTTGFKFFMPNEAGYRELRALFEYLLQEKVIKPPGSKAGDSNTYEVCVIDADDLLDHPKEVVHKFCDMTGIKFCDEMLEWEANEGCESFDKWKGFHEDAIGSGGLRPRTTISQKKIRTREEERQEWLEKYGEEAVDIIQRTVDENMKDYEFLRQFRITI